MRHAGLLAVLISVSAVGLVFYQEPLVADYMRHLASWLFRQFENDTFPLVLAASIVSVAFVMLVAYLFLIVVPQAVSLRRLRAVVNQCADERAFAEKFQEISHRLRAR